MKVTIKDVAKHAGVGLGTASRAINGSKDVSEKTRQKVMDSIREIGYIPDPVAKSMRSQKYKNIAYFVNDIYNSAYARISKGIQATLEKAGYTLIVCNTGDDGAAEKVNSFLKGHNLDGIILSIHTESDHELLQLFRQKQVPIVAVDRDIKGIPSAIVIDYYSSVKKATQYLLSLGHSGIAVIAGSQDLLPTRVSINGCRDALAEYGRSEIQPVIFNGPFSEQFGEKAMKRLLPDIRQGDITALIVLNSSIFSGVLQVMRENDIDYPEDISLITAENSELTRLLKPSVTVINRPLLRAGEHVAEYMIQTIEHPGAAENLRPTVIPTELIIRNSCMVRTKNN